jgi:hypothetical protein
LPAPEVNVGFLSLRSLAASRVALALVLLLDLGLRAVDLSTFYTEDGVLPRPLGIEASYDRFLVSLHFANDTLVFQAALFLLTAGCAAAFLVGWNTRLATAGCWLLLLSLHYRNTLVLNGSDHLLRILLFWGIALPFGSFASIDRRLGRARPVDALSRVVMLIYAAQVVLVYVSSGIHKWSEPAWQQGDGLYYALAADQYATRLGQFLTGYPDAVRPFNFIAMGVELLLPWLVFSPWGGARLRTLLVVFFAGFHLITALLLDVGLFPLIAIAAWIGLLPDAFWDRVAASARTTGPAPARSSRVLRGGVLLYLLLAAWVLYWNAAGWGRLGLPAMPDSIQPIPTLLGLRQRWDMFARPIFVPEYWVIPGKLADGSDVELFTGDVALLHQPPEHVTSTIPNGRWLKYMVFITEMNRDSHRRSYARFLCRRWPVEHPERPALEAFKIYFVKRTTFPGAGHGPWKAVMMWQHECRDGQLRAWGPQLSAPRLR